mmetsp:Transcript_437/g.1294  ORF Transcript_437/g.1294 Transcript_437/m.1294 type:complete len:204 (+) Transcript_437:1237-1848(+)
MPLRCHVGDAGECGLKARSSCCSQWLGTRLSWQHLCQIATACRCRSSRAGLRHDAGQREPHCIHIHRRKCRQSLPGGGVHGGGVSVGRQGTLHHGIRHLSRHHLQHTSRRGALRRGSQAAQRCKAGSCGGRRRLRAFIWAHPRPRRGNRAAGQQGRQGGPGLRPPAGGHEGGPPRDGNLRHCPRRPLCHRRPGALQGSHQRLP